MNDEIRSQLDSENHIANRPRTKPTFASAEPSAPDAGPTGTVVDAAQILGGAREIWLEYEGARYRLRVTRRGKLILQK